jgi:hypothetical protein
METPCIKVCLMDPKSHLCLGCGRTLAEIAGWSRMESAERRSIMSGLGQRMLIAGLAPPEKSGN